MTSDELARCPWCESEYWTATVEKGFTWYTCVYCECMWSENNEREVTE